MDYRFSTLYDWLKYIVACTLIGTLIGLSYGLVIIVKQVRRR
jgi:hypothetical protein